MCVVGFRLDHIAEVLAHLLRKPEAEIVLQDEADAALSGLAVDADHVCVVAAADVLGIDRDIRHSPFDVVVSFTVSHAFGDGILMGSGECCEYQSSAIRASRIDVHAGILFVLIHDLQHVVKLQTGIHTLAVHIQSKCDNVHIAGPLAVSEDRSFDTVCACKKAHLRIGHTRSAVVVRMQGENDIFTIFQVV